MKKYTKALRLKEELQGGKIKIYETNPHCNGVIDYYTIVLNYGKSIVFYNAILKFNNDEIFCIHYCENDSYKYEIRDCNTGEVIYVTGNKLELIDGHIRLFVFNTSELYANMTEEEADKYYYILYHYCIIDKYGKRLTEIYKDMEIADGLVIVGSRYNKRALINYTTESESFDDFHSIRNQYIIVSDEIDKLKQYLILDTKTNKFLSSKKFISAKFLTDRYVKVITDKNVVGIYDIDRDILIEYIANDIRYNDETRRFTFTKTNIASEHHYIYDESIDGLVYDKSSEVKDFEKINLDIILLDDKGEKALYSILVINDDLIIYVIQEEDGSTPYCYFKGAIHKTNSIIYRFKDSPLVSSELRKHVSKEYKEMI